MFRLLFLVVSCSSSVLAMEKEEKKFEITPNALGVFAYDESYVEALRDICQALYFFNNWYKTKDRIKIQLIPESNKTKLAEAKQYTLIPLDSGFDLEVLFTLKKLLKYDMNVELRKIFDTLSKIAEINASLLLHLSRLDEQFIEQAQEKEMLENAIIAINLDSMYEQLRYELAHYVIKFAPENKKVYAFAKTKDGDTLPMKLNAPLEKEREASVPKERDFSEKKKKNTKAKKMHKEKKRDESSNHKKKNDKK